MKFVSSNEYPAGISIVMANSPLSDCVINSNPTYPNGTKANEAKRLNNENKITVILPFQEEIHHFRIRIYS